MYLSGVGDHLQALKGVSEGTCTVLHTYLPTIRYCVRIRPGAAQEGRASRATAPAMRSGAARTGAWHRGGGEGKRGRLGGDMDKACDEAQQVLSKAQIHQRNYYTKPTHNNHQNDRNIRNTYN